MRRAPKISDTEWEVMNAVWSKEPVPASAIIEALQKSDPSWHPKTAKTLLNRLVKKGALAFKRQGREYLYETRVRRESCVAAESESFLDRLFGGSLKPMLAHMVDHKKLSAREIAELKNILDQHD